MPRVSEMKGAKFDGKGMGYVPPKTLKVSEKLSLHSKRARRIDPITYEVVRHSLWHVNEEHGATIQRLSGSPVAMYALDLNPSILAEDGEFVYFGPYMQYMSGVTDTQVKWILEYRSDNPGIRDGDMFLANDPWVGAAHQQDVMLICPVFWKGELFCWVTNCLHQYDIGGITPGSMPPGSTTVEEEGVLIDNFLLVEQGRLREAETVALLTAGPWPARNPAQNVADLRAHGGEAAALLRLVPAPDRRQVRVGGVEHGGELAVLLLRDLVAQPGAAQLCQQLLAGRPQLGL